MHHGILRWTIYLLCLMVLGPIAGVLTGALHAVDGGPGATPLVCATPGAGLAAGLAALAIALVIGLIAARLLGTGPGMSSAGLVLAWATWRTGTIDQLIRTSHAGTPFLTLALEGLIFGGLGALLAVALWAVGKVDDKGPLVRPTPRAPEPAAPVSLQQRLAAGLIAPLRSKGGALALAVALVAGGVGAWFIGVTPLKGQALMAAVAAATLAAAAGRLVEFTTPMPALFLAVALLAVLGPLSGVATAGTGIGAVVTSYRGALFPLANICPLDWIAGGLLGIPLGVAWAGSMIEKRSE